MLHEFYNKFYVEKKNIDFYENLFQEFCQRSTFYLFDRKGLNNLFFLCFRDVFTMFSLTKFKVKKNMQIHCGIFIRNYLFLNKS